MGKAAYRSVITALLLIGAGAILTGCIASTAASVITAPVKAVGKGVDVLTTSQSEADEKRGRALRKREERLGKLDRKRRKLAERCEDGKSSACDDLDDVNAEIEDLMDEPI